MTSPISYHPIKNERGMALIVALTVITVLVSLSLALYQKMNTAFDASVTAHHSTTLSHMASSGVQVAMAVLARDKLETKIDSIQEDWADPEVIAEALAEITFDAGDLTVSISDERSRIQVNALVDLPGHEFNDTQEQLWTRFFEFLTNNVDAFADLEYSELIESLKDWIDSGDDDAITGLGGAESGYYQSLDPPYDCRNAPLDHLSDIARIKGFPPELFATGEGMTLISDLLTVFGSVATGDQAYTFDGKININTAGLLVLSAVLPDGYETYAQDMVDYREESDADDFVNDLSSLTWYQDISGLEEVTLSPNLITNESDLFRITATATLDGDSLTAIAVVRREAVDESDKWRCQVLYWETN